MSTIQNNNADLQAILDAVNALPDKVEGAEYETCTVNLYANTGVFTKIVYLSVIDGVIQQNTITPNNIELTLENTLRGSLVYFENDAYPFVRCDGYNADIVYCNNSQSGDVKVIFKSNYSSADINVLGY